MFPLAGHGWLSVMAPRAHLLFLCPLKCVGSLKARFIMEREYIEVKPREKELKSDRSKTSNFSKKIPMHIFEKLNYVLQSVKE